MSLNAWDVCAGMVLVAEAGGTTSDFFAEEVMGSRPMFAANRMLFPTLESTARSLEEPAPRSNDDRVVDS